MATEFKLPDLGEGVESADIVNVLVSVGDVIAVDQDVLEAETDKAVMEVPTSVAGKVTAIHVAPGDTVTIGQLLLSIDADAAGAAPAAAEKPKAETAEAQPAAETPKPAEKPAEAAAPAAPAAAPAPAPPAEKPAVAPAGLPVAAAPSVRQFAREIGVDISTVTGSGAGGRIDIDDVKAHARAHGTAGCAIGGGGAAAGPAGGSRREKLSKLRKTAANHLANAWSTIPHVTLHDTADVTDLEAFRQANKKAVERAGGRLTITPLFMKVCVAALQAHPVVNASLHLDDNEVEYKDFYNLGIAVDTPRGLVVPVIRDVDKKSVAELAKELGEVSVKARDGKLTPNDMSGATFTITNLGSIGVGFFTPLINAPEVAILGMGRATQQPVWNESHKQFVPRLLAPLSLSFDHRLVDGADGARFLRHIVDVVEHPHMLLM